MNCPVCGNRTKVLNSKTDDIFTYRRHKCDACFEEFCTREEIMNYEEGMKELWKLSYRENAARKERKKNADV